VRELALSGCRLLIYDRAADGGAERFCTCLKL